MGSMDDILRRSLLFDFYGELLTDHQKNIYEASVSEDLSLSEIAAQEGLSRQGVHDLITRTDKILENYEKKLHLVERFLQMKDQVQAIRETAVHASGFCDDHDAQKQDLDRIIELTDQLMDAL